MGGKEKGVRKFTLRSVLEDRLWPAWCPVMIDQKQNSDVIGCLYTDAGLQIPTWEHLLGTAT